MSDKVISINFPEALWERVLSRSRSPKGITVRVNGEETWEMRAVNPDYLVCLLVKAGLDELDLQSAE